eukprot:TRINITY_DN5135_c0_g2_i1.p1 TRINITY_DN5135_c0_g2~~TRINITY_DN5135_c0_g2_i1.p1  ORF type:complete len:504 (+),score=198.19 TRINITY_DN5135_c0_g2_i1:233-1744(+)
MNINEMSSKEEMRIEDEKRIEGEKGLEQEKEFNRRVDGIKQEEKWEISRRVMEDTGTEGRTRAEERRMEEERRTEEERMREEQRRTEEERRTDELEQTREEERRTEEVERTGEEERRKEEAERIREEEMRKEEQPEETTNGEQQMGMEECEGKRIEANLEEERIEERIGGQGMEGEIFGRDFRKVDKKSEKCVHEQEQQETMHERNLEEENKKGEKERKILEVEQRKGEDEQKKGEEQKKETNFSTMERRQSKLRGLRRGNMEKKDETESVPKEGEIFDEHFLSVGMRRGMRGSIGVVTSEKLFPKNLRPSLPVWDVDQQSPPMDNTNNQQSPVTPRSSEENKKLRIESDKAQNQRSLRRERRKSPRHDKVDIRDSFDIEKARDRKGSIGKSLGQLSERHGRDSHDRFSSRTRDKVSEPRETNSGEKEYSDSTMGKGNDNKEGREVSSNKDVDGNKDMVDGIKPEEKGEIRGGGMEDKGGEGGRRGEERRGERRKILVATTGS